MAAPLMSRKETYSAYDVVIQDKKLYVEGKEYFIKGMAYNPAPLGGTIMDDHYGGGGLCSEKMTVFREYKSACFGSDYFDGTMNPEREPRGPFDSLLELVPWWWNVWMRDMPIMKEMGVNTIRIYNLNPFTKHYLSSEKGKTRYPSANPERGAQHLPFLDLCHLFGFKVMIPIIQDETLLRSSTDEELDELIESQIDEMGNHPALIMYALGNELGLYTKPELKELVTAKMAKIREYQFQRWNRTVPVTTAVIDLPLSYNELAENLGVDIFTSNAGYREYDYTPLWNGENTADYNFSGWRELSEQHQLPLLVGEFGMHNQPYHNSHHPDWFNQQWKQMLEHIEAGCIGAVFFEYSDEAKKAEEQAEMGALSPKPFGGPEIGVTSLDNNVWAPDLMIKKSPVFEAIKEGYKDSVLKEYNMNADVWELIGRERTTLSNYVTAAVDSPLDPPAYIPFPQDEYPPSAPTDFDPSGSIPPGDFFPNDSAQGPFSSLSLGTLLLITLTGWLTQVLFN